MSVLLTAERISGSETELHLFNLIIGLNGYTVCSGVISAELNGRNIISKPLDVEEYMRIGIISRKGVGTLAICKGVYRSIEGALYVMLQ